MPRIEYAGDIRIQRARDGVFLKRVSMDEMDRLRDGLAATRRGLPRCFALWEEANQRLSGLVYPIPEGAERFHIMFRHVPDLLTSFADRDDATDSFSRYARHALVHHAASMLAARMPVADLKRRGIVRGVVARWRAEGFRAAAEAEADIHEVGSVGRMLKEAS